MARNFYIDNINDNDKLNEIRRNKTLIQNETIILKLETVINKYFLLITKHIIRGEDQC